MICSESAEPVLQAVFTCFQRFHHSPVVAVHRSMLLLRIAASALLRTTTEIPSLCPLVTARFVRLSLRHPPGRRPFSASVCLCSKKQRSLWLQLTEGQTMGDGNFEEILAPLRQAVKEQVQLMYLLLFTIS